MASSSSSESSSDSEIDPRVFKHLLKKLLTEKKSKKKSGKESRKASDKSASASDAADAQQSKSLTVGTTSAEQSDACSLKASASARASKQRESGPRGKVYRELRENQRQYLAEQARKASLENPNRLSAAEKERSRIEAETQLRERRERHKAEYATIAARQRLQEKKRKEEEDQALLLARAEAYAEEYNEQLIRQEKAQEQAERLAEISKALEALKPEIQRRVEAQRKIDKQLEEDEERRVIEKELEREREFEEKFGAPKQNKSSTIRRTRQHVTTAERRAEQSNSLPDAADEDFKWELPKQTDPPKQRTDRYTDSTDTASEVSSPPAREIKPDMDRPKSTKKAGGSRMPTARSTGSTFDPMGQYFSDKIRRVKKTYEDEMLKTGRWLPRSYQQFLRRNELRGIDMSNMNERQRILAWLDFKEKNPTEEEEEGRKK